MLDGSHIVAAAKARIDQAVGGPGRIGIILILATILGLDMADKGTLSAVSGPIEKAFGVGNTQIGLLFAVVSFIGAIGTLPAGILADRIRRKNVLLVVIPIWGIAMIVSAAASSYVFLLVTRLFLGLVTAAAWPCTASMTGDFFPARERAGIYGLIVSGEMIGAGIGFFVSGEVSSWFNWHWSFVAMAIPSFILTWVIWKYLPEPERNTQSWLEEGGGSQASEAQTAAQKKHVPPREHLVLHEDPSRRSLWWAIAYLVKIPTYMLLIIASSLTYYFFSGIRTFGMIYFTGHYALTRSTMSPLIFPIGIGALIGVVGGGRLADRLLHRGKLRARIIIPGIALFLATIFLGLGIWTSTLVWGIITLTVGAVALAAAIPPIDAARLDIVHPAIWGRGESGRMALRALLEGAAPLLFGAVSVWLGGGEIGLERTFLIMLIPMLVASALAIPGQRTYPRDVATAAASVEATKKKSAQGASKREPERVMKTKTG